MARTNRGACAGNVGSLGVALGDAAWSSLEVAVAVAVGNGASTFGRRNVDM